ncbi:MAG: winged helix DNA-binding domain-containing protein, partial [Chloroflexi bacterium]
MGLAGQGSAAHPVQRTTRSHQGQGRRRNSANRGESRRAAAARAPRLVPHPSICGGCGGGQQRRGRRRHHLDLTAERTLTARDLNRALLARQFLLERSSSPLVPTLERIAGLQTQYAPSGYIGLWSRMRNFRREALTTALEQRRVIQGTLLRSTIHMVSARD